METRRLQYLFELSRTGSMRAVADLLDTSTSTVSQQIAVLTREVGVPLVEPVGRQVRLTAAGRRLAEHAVPILAAVEAARSELDPATPPRGVVRVAGFASAIRRMVTDVVPGLALDHPQVRLELREHEPAEAVALLAADAVDLALTYDYQLAPAATHADLEALPLWTTRWGLGVPADLEHPGGGALDLMRSVATREWIGNSRNAADEDVVRVLGSMAGVTPVFRHQADSLDLVEDLVIAGLGIGLLPLDRRARAGVEVLPLTDPVVELRAWGLLRRGRTRWSAAALILDALAGPVSGRRG